MAIKFRGVDFLEFDSLLTDEERLVRDTTRKFIEENLIPIIEECNRAGRFPRELVKPMADLGFYGASLKGYGCAGMSNVEYGLVMQELERGDSGIRSFVLPTAIGKTEIVRNVTESELLAATESMLSLMRRNPLTMR